MTSPVAFIPVRIKRIVAGIIVAGFSAAALIYLKAASGSVGWTGDSPEDSKRYLHDMEVFAGKGNLLAGDLRQWFASLWHGRNLAYTVAVLTVLAALAVLFFGTPLPSPGKPGAAQRNGRGSSVQ